MTEFLGKLFNMVGNGKWIVTSFVSSKSNISMINAFIHFIEVLIAFCITSHVKQAYKTVVLILLIST